MVEPIDDDVNAPSENQEDEKEGKGRTGRGGTAGGNAGGRGMLSAQSSEIISNAESEDQGDKEEGEGRSGRGGRSGGGVGIKLPPNKLKDVVSVWQHLDLADAVARVAEFFSELPARASANLSVNWSSVKRHGYALVSHFISSGQEIAHLMRSRDAGFIKRLRTKYGVNVRRVGAPGANPGFEPTMT